MLNTIKYLIKFIPERKYAEALLDGDLFMRCAAYYHQLERQEGPGKGDLREGTIFHNTMIYKYIDAPIYCMYMVEQDDITDGYTLIKHSVVDDFKCRNGYLVLMEYPQFAEAIKSIYTGGIEMRGGKVQYGIASNEISSHLLNDCTADNLFIKDPYFSEQKEFRLIVLDSIPGRASLDIKDLHRTYHIPGGTRAFSKLFYIPSVPSVGNRYLLPLL